MLGLAQTGQVGVDGGGDGTLVTEIDLDLAEVLALFEQVRGIAVTQGVEVGGLFDAAGLERQAEGALECGAGHGMSGAGTDLATVALGRKEQCGMTMSLPLLAQQFQRALR